MKPFFTLIVLFAVPFVLSLVMLAIGVSLLWQHFNRRKPSNDALVFPYLTSWEEAA